MKILRGGCASRHEASFILSRPYGQDNHVILLLRSGGKYIINDQIHYLEPGHAIIIAPQTKYSYSNPSGIYQDDWIHFKLEDFESLPSKLKCNTPFPLNDFETCSLLIRQLLWEQAYTSAQFAPANINALSMVLLNHLTAAFLSECATHLASPYQQEFRKLRMQMQNNLKDEHSISKYAKKLSMSTSHFQHLYTQLFGISFQNDLIHLRIAYAEILLETTDLPIEDISETCGYKNSIHFFRQFKQQKGLTPSKYRKVRPLI